jgi:hypothetical protein
MALQPLCDMHKIKEFADRIKKQEQEKRGFYNSVPKHLVLGFV